MISIDICGSTKNLEDISESWIYEQILNRQKESVKIWIKVIIENRDANVNIVLTSANCPPSKAAQRKTHHNEKELFDLWETMGMKDVEIKPKQLMKFLYKVKNM